MKIHSQSSPALAVASGFLATALWLVCGCTGDRPSVASTAETALPEAALVPLHTSLAAYEESRGLLAKDTFDDLREPATRLAENLEAARKQLPDGTDPMLARSLEEAALAARSMARAADLEAARIAFGEVSRSLLVLGAADPRLQEGLYVFECPMTDTFPNWMQRGEEIDNPFMGTVMSTCGVPADWTAPPPESMAEIEAHAAAVHGDAGDGGDVAFYTCSMHPSVKNPEPGTCPICSMDLVPVTEEEVATGVIRLDAARRQTIGVKTAPAVRRPLKATIRAVGSVTYDETRLSEVTLKVEGWVGEVLAAETGQAVERGQTLFTLYSPRLLAAQEELLTALRSQRAARETEVPDRADYLVEASRRRLRLWDLEEAQIDEIVARNEPIEYLPVVSPVSGYVIEKNVLEGAAVKPGARLYQIAALDTVWVEAEVYEADLPLVEAGQKATLKLPYLPDRTLEGRVAFVYPYLEGSTRTGTIRIRLANPGLTLKPDMYANVVIERALGERLVVPEEAVLYAGERSFVFLDLGEGRLKPTAIEPGIQSGDDIEILAGIEEGDRVVTSGNFLVAAESRLKLAMEHWQ